MTLHNLTLQVESLANATEEGLRDLNIQVQANTKMTLQNRLTLDLLLLKEHGVCGYLNFQNDSCCIHIPNVTGGLNEQLDKIKQAAQSSKELRAELENLWLNKILHRLGFSLTSWLAGLLQSLIVIVVVIIVICITVTCLKWMLMNTFIPLT